MPTAGVAIIRQETVERLAEIAAFRHVYDSRQPQLRRDMLPAVRVYTSSTSQGLSLSQPEFRTTTNLVIQIVGEDITDARTAETVDELCERVRERLFWDGTWLTLFERVLSVETEVDRNVDGEWRSTTATLTIALQCTEAYGPDSYGGENTPWERLPWLRKADVRVDVIDPAADPNTGPPGTPPNVEGGYVGGHPGPDGRIEVHANFINPPPEEES